MLYMAVAPSSSGMVTKSQGQGAILGFFSPLTMHCNVFTAKKDHAIANDVMPQQASFRRCHVRCERDQGKRDQPIGQEGVMGVHSTDEV